MNRQTMILQTTSNPNLNPDKGNNKSIQRTAPKTNNNVGTDNNSSGRTGQQFRLNFQNTKMHARRGGHAYTYANQEGPKRVFLPKAMYRKKFFRNNINLNLKKHCFIYIKQTFNNTFITVKNKKKKLLLTKSCGSIGFKGKKRSAYYASIQLAKRIRTLVKRIKKTATIILLSKPTKHMKLIISNLSNKFDLKIKEIVERIPVSHNGLRKSHVRRK